MWCFSFLFQRRDREIFLPLLKVSLRWYLLLEFVFSVESEPESNRSLVIQYRIGRIIESFLFVHNLGMHKRNKAPKSNSFIFFCIRQNNKIYTFNQAMEHALCIPITTRVQLMQWEVIWDLHSAPFLQGQEKQIHFKKTRNNLKPSSITNKVIAKGKKSMSTV